jgi:hypothetical protein
MSCSLKDADFPKYLKGYIEEALAGRDETLKGCVCQIKAPVKDGCLILDEDEKNVAFPFCLADSAPSSPYLEANIGLSYKDAMRFFWNRSSIKIIFEAKGAAGNINPQSCNGVWSSSGSTTLQTKGLELKDLFCGEAARGAEADNTTNPKAPTRSDGGKCTYPTDGLYPKPYFGVAAGFWLAYEGKRGWIDKNNKLIYPFYYTYESLNGCCGNLRSTSGSSDKSKITINMATYGSAEYGGFATGKIILTNPFVD